MQRLFGILCAVLIVAGLLAPAIPVAADATNLINNPSVETVSGGAPANWTANSWGSNTSSLTVSTDAHTGTNSLLITTTARTGGDAKWLPDPVNVVSGNEYTYSEYYKSSVATEIDAAYYDASNNVSYVYLQSVPASASWQSLSTNFTIPATAQRVVVMHILAAVGSVTMDDFSLVNASNPTPPPTGNNLIPNPSFETANGSAPAGWQHGGWGTNTTQYTYASNGNTGSRSALINVSSYTNGDAKWYFSPLTVQPNTQYTFSDYYKSSVVTSLVAQFDNGSGSLNYQTLASVPVSTNWTSVTATFTTPSTAKTITIFHLIAGVGNLQVDDVSLSLVAANGAPTVSITAPTAGTTVSGSVTISANALAQQGIKSVQFMIDGANFGSAVTIAPYQQTWNTTTATNANHTISALVTASDNQTATSAAVQVTVNNSVAPGTNLISNPSLETPDPTNSKLPQSWNKGGWGTNTFSETYLTTGHTGTRSIKTTITSFTNGSAYWSTTNIPIVGGQMYDFSDYYQSNITSEVDLTFTMSDGSVQYQYLGDASPSKASWTKFRDQFAAPAGAVAVSIVHDIFAVGYVTTDDYSLTPFSYQGFNRAIVSLTFDDAWKTIYTNGLPLLQKYGFCSTQYIITGSVDVDPAYMTSAMVKNLDATCNEIASHTVTHPDLTTLTATKMDNELKNSQTFLQTLLGKPVTNFASPYGAYNQQVLTDAQKYYGSYRGVEAGFNAKNNFDIGHLMVQNMLSTTTLAEVQGWVAQAKATNTWLILVYHQVDPSSAAGDYNTYPSDLDAQLTYIKSSGIAVETVKQALAELTPQL